MIERVVRVGLVKEINEAINDGIDIQYGLPVLPQNVQTDLAFQVNVGMVDPSLAFDLGRGMRIVSWNGKDKLVRCACPVARVGRDFDRKGGQVVGVGEINLSHLASVQTCNVY